MLGDLTQPAVDINKKNLSEQEEVNEEWTDKTDQETDQHKDCNDECSDQKEEDEELLEDRTEKTRETNCHVEHWFGIVNFDHYDGIVGCVNVQRSHWKFVYLHAPSSQIFVVDPANADSDLEDSSEAAKCFRLNVTSARDGFMHLALG
ncbi:hypothetical protein PAMA_008899 [Pampus argenteus]